MLSWAIYSTMLKTHKTGLNYLTFILVIVILGLIFLLPKFLFEFNNQELIKFNFAFFLIISYVVLFAGLGAYIFWNKAVLIVGPSRAGIFLHLMPVFSSFMAIFLFNEKFMNFHIFGTIVIILGIFFSSKKTSLS
jgi:drug/metabolite transporter (DMT)-like permease